MKRLFVKCCLRLKVQVRALTYSGVQGAIMYITMYSWLHEPTIQFPHEDKNLEKYYFTRLKCQISSAVKKKAKKRKHCKLHLPTQIPSKHNGTVVIEQ